VSDYEEKTIRLMAQEGGRLLSEIESLRAENEKLRVELTDLSLKSCPSCGIKVANEELRELVRDMWPHVRHRSRMCNECELPCDTSDECLLYEPMRQRMAELGVEVDE
jgi:hypothetical protein